jgi:hypothetical protein
VAKVTLRKNSFSGVTQKVNNNRKHNNQTNAGQGAQAASVEPLKIGASTPFDFSARNLTAYGGLLPVATMLEKLGSSNWWKRRSPSNG